MKRGAFFLVLLLGIVLGGSGCGKKREIDAAFNNAEWLETKGNYRGAIARYEAVLELAPRSEFSVIARMKIADIYYKRLRDYDNGRSMYRMVASLHPDSIQALDAKRRIEEIERILGIKAAARKEGDAFFAEGSFREALDKYREAQSLDPSDPSLREKVEVAQERYDRKRKREAAAAIERGDDYFSRGKYEEAIGEYHTARELSPENGAAWDKIDIVRARLAPAKREKAFERASAGGKELDLVDPEAASFLLDRLPPDGTPGSPAKDAQGSAADVIYRAKFSVDLPDYSHYLQGYKVLWRPGNGWRMVRFHPPEYRFPFLKVPIREYEEFETLCSGERGAGAGPRIEGAALFKITGREEGGDISAELVDARLEVPGKGYLYVIRREAK